jgi:tryptophan synthase beta chain
LTQSKVAPDLQGKYEYDFADYAEITPVLMMCTLGHKIDMEPIKADGLHYHGCSPIIRLLRNKGYIDTVAYPSDEKHVFEMTKLFMEIEGWLPAPESAYSVCSAIEQAIKCKESGEPKVIAFNVSDHGFLDIHGYRTLLGLE